MINDCMVMAMIVRTKHVVELLQLGGASSRHWHIQSTGGKPIMDNTGSGLLPGKHYYLASITGNLLRREKFSNLDHAMLLSHPASHSVM